MEGGIDMLIKLEDRYKDFYTVRDLERARRVIKEQKEDTETAKGWAEYAVREALGNDCDYLVEVLKAKAHTAKNRRAFDRYFEGSDDMDVWVEATAETRYGFIKVGAYLTDIWQTGAEHYKDHMYIQYFKEVK